MKDPATKATDWAVLALLCCVAVLGYLGQGLPAILLQPIKLDLNLSDSTIGIITGLGVTIVGASAAYPIGAAADTFGRSLVLGLSVIIWSAFVAGLAFAQSTAGYAAGVIGFNLGDAAMLPLIYAMVASRFGPQTREIANGILVSVLLLSGTGIFALGGYLLTFFEANSMAGLAPWRLVCLAVAALGPAVALMVFFSGKTRGQASKPQSQTETPNTATYGDFLRSEGTYIVALLLAISVFYSAYSVFLFWLPAILTRTFDVAPAAANQTLGEVMFFAALAGIIVTFSIMKWVRGHYGLAAPLYLVMAGCAIVLAPASALFFVERVTTFYWMVAMFVFGMSVSMMLVPSLLQSCAPERYRSRTIALFPILSGMMRIALPAIVGYVSTRYGEDGKTLITILSVMLVSCFAISLVALVFITPRFAEFAERNLSEAR